MLKNENIICISSIDWEFIWQGHQEIMESFAKNGNRVLFIENTGVRAPGIKDIPRIKARLKNWFKGIKGIRKQMDNLYIFSPLVLPFPYAHLTRWVNRYFLLDVLGKWIKAMDFNNPIIWTFLPTPVSVDIIDKLVKKMVIYYCIDNFSVSSIYAKKIKKSEVALLKKADLVFVTSSALYEYCSKYNGKVYKFPFAVSFDKFETARSGIPRPSEDLTKMQRPIIGYVGGVHRWIDQRLIKELAERNSSYSFVFVGPVQTDISSLLYIKNVYFLGNKEHGEIPHLIQNFDVCLIPYLITDYTKDVYPTKLNEYLAMGKAVVSTSLPEVASFNKRYGNIVYVSEGIEDFDNYIKKVLVNDSPGAANRRIEVAKENSWSTRIEEMSNLVKEAIEKGKLDRERKWKEYLLIFFRRAKRRTVRVAVFLVLLYLLLFKSPFIWFLASPLKISDVPKKADAIVVFGGGVGETGSPGKSTIERARYAADLYNKGYADTIIFSSGYTYIYNDAENMRLVALSTGVPEKDIILDEKANNTYENVVYSAEILNKHNWGSILLVSSPYNMRRAALIFNKFANNIKIVYTPVPKGQFYDRTFGVNTQHIRAIMHEYMGIIYYWWKGYI